jgi:hypothetical protein
MGQGDRKWDFFLRKVGGRAVMSYFLIGCRCKKIWGFVEIERDL